MNARRLALLAVALLAVALFATAAGAGSASAVDPDLRFVEAMRERGMHDLAIEYLESASRGAVVTEGLRGRIAYELAATRLDRVRTLPTAAERETAIATARQELGAFLGGNDDQKLAAEGNGRLADAVASQARRGAVQAVSLSGEDKDKASKRVAERARKDFDEARALYQTAEQAFADALAEYKTVKPGSPEALERLDLRRRLAGVRVKRARTLHDKAKTYPDGAKQFKKLNTEAADELLDLYDKYYDQPIGLYAHLYEGWCYQAIGDHKLAKGCFEVLIEQDPEAPAFRELITLGHVYLMASLIAEEKAAQAFDRGSEWLEELQPGESPAAAAALRYQLGEAARLAAEAESGSDARRLRLRAQQLLREAGRVPGEFQTRARESLAALNEQLGEELAPPETFADAYQLGKDAVATMSASRLAVKAAAANNPEGAAGLRRRIDGARQEALVAFRQALSLVDDETDARRINEVRYLLSYLYWEAGDYLETAAISEFLVGAYPDDPSAKPAAKLAFASLQRLYDDATESGGDGEFELAQLRRVADFATRRWAGEPTAETAFSVLLSLAIRSGDLDQARELVSQVPERARPAMSLKLASALWERAVKMSATAGDDPAARAGAQRAKADALAMLREGVSAVGDAAASPATATGALYLAQAELEAGDADRAAQLLEDEKLGALTLVEKKAGAAERPGFAAEAYKTALRAYVATKPPRTDDALRMMDRLEEAVGGGATLTRIYFGLGLQLQRQIAELTAAGKSDAASRLVEAFAVFLDRLSERSAEADWVTQQWIGQTFLNLGDGLSSSGAAGSARRDYFQRSSAVFQAMIDRAAAEPGFPPSSNSVLAARMQLGQSQRMSGDYEAAVDTFSSILVERPVMLDVQKAAAYTYQEWGAASDADQLLNAIRGGRTLPETGKNLIWGWSKLAKIAARQPKFQDLFFECWLNIATCRTIAAEQTSGADREKQLTSARRTIRSVVRQYPQLGGPQRRRDFDRLLKRIQRLEGADAIGLKELET